MERAGWALALCPQELCKWGKGGTQHPLYESLNPHLHCPQDPLRDPGILAQLSQDTLRWTVLAVVTLLSVRDT